MDAVLTMEPPLLAHPGPGGQRGPQNRRPQVDLEGFDEPDVVLVDERTERRVGTGIVDQDVDAAESFQRQVDAPRGSLFVDSVRGDTQSVAFHFGRCGVGGVLPSRGQDHIAAGRGNRLCRSQTDTTGAAGDDRGAAGEIQSAHADAPSRY